MNKMKKAFEKNKKYLILFLVLWIVLEIVLIAPMSVAIAESTSAQGQFELANFIENFGKEVSSFTAITRIGSAGAGSAFGKGTLWLTILCLVVTAIGIIKSKPKNNYEDIENGSSDWCEGGEQYRILNKNKGIILAEDNYLPVDKRGNVNVLVVGGSGSGKSASYSIPNAYQMLGSYVFTDPKGELYDKTAGYLKANGYDIKVLNLVNPENSDGYNPLMHIQSEIDVDVIANTIIKGQDSDGKGSDPFYTIGQRRGLGIHLNRPVFVKDIFPEKNEIVLAPLQSLEKTEMWLENWNLINENRVLGCSDIIVKIRYRKQENHGTVTVTPEHLLHIQLHEPLTAIAPGQAAAFYKDDLLLGGGIIVKAR